VQVTLLHISVPFYCIPDITDCIILYPTLVLYILLNYVSLCLYTSYYDSGPCALDNNNNFLHISQSNAIRTCMKWSCGVELQRYADQMLW